MFEPTWTWPNFTLVNFSCELGQIMTRYDFLWARSFEKSPNVVLTKIQNFIEIQSSRFRWYSFVFARTQSRLVSLLVNFSCELGQIMTRYDSYGLDEWFWAMFEPTWTWPNFTFGQLFMWIGANNDQIWLPMG